MDTINVAIVEDKQMHREQLEKYLKQYQTESGKRVNISTFTDGDEIAENYKGGYDIILLDIQMQFMDGMTAAEKIRRQDQEVIIIFITSMGQYAVRGYEVDALDYIVKPVNYFAFSRKLDRAIGRIKDNIKYFISIPIEHGIRKLDINDIFYIESQGHSIIYITKQEEIISRGAMGNLEEMLSKYGFFRCNKSYIVNMKHVERIQDGGCLIAGANLLISRAKKKPFLEALASHISEVVR